tara:strand:- start:10710 stop:12887 length:2178 start_codon:yes stop_codon:yes gene_type:complete
MAAFSETGSVRKPLPSQEVIAKLPADGGEEFNRLIFSQSPYLLQHARNTVDWHPWGEEAFALAAKEDKPVFLSVGYSTCHWCHVMEHESFEDEEVGKKINENYIAIKVDREERPDIDEVYMTVTQSLTGGGGWPMTVIMTADKKPFFAGTYFPKNDQPGRRGLMSTLDLVNDYWANNRQALLDDANNITKLLKESMESQEGDVDPEAVIQQTFDGLAERHDAKHGGFGSAPKFPVPPNLSFLLRYHQQTGNAKALEMVENQLTAMRKGGVYDHVGFGIHRYSTDPIWLLPHFEKMLYDQALAAIAYIEAYQATGNALYADTAKEIFTYVLRDMTSETGGFYSAEDADSEGVEGKFYVWTPKEVIEVLGEEDGAIFNQIFSITEDGNFVEEAKRVRTGDSIPHLKLTIGELAQRIKQEPAQLAERIEGMRAKLFAHRESRVHPIKDDKILTDWNGLMIAALAKAAQAFDSAEYRDAAMKAADFVLTTLRDENGRLLKRYRAGEAGLTAHLEDYAFVVWGLIDLYEATFETRFLEAAIELTDSTLEHFWDDKEGAFFMTADDAEELLVRSKKLYGGAIPSGNAVSALNLVRLHRITARPEFEERFHALIQGFGKQIAQSPSSFPLVMTAIDFQHGSSKEIVVTGDLAAPDTQAMLAAIRTPFLPNKVVVFRSPGEESPITKLAPYTESQLPIDGNATAYVCENFACHLPTTDLAKMIELIGIQPANK